MYGLFNIHDMKCLKCYPSPENAVQTPHDINIYSSLNQKLVCAEAKIRIRDRVILHPTSAANTKCEPLAEYKYHLPTHCAVTRK